MKARDLDEEMAALREERWTAEDARRVLAACEQSGLSQSAFCREHGLQAKRLCWWRKRLRDWDTPRASTDGVRLAPAVVPATAKQVKVRLLGDVAIEIADVSASFVASLVSALREGAL